MQARINQGELFVGESACTFGESQARGPGPQFQTPWMAPTVTIATSW